MDFILILLGFAALVGGGEALVRGAVSVATRLNISPMVIGLTLVGFGTSTPELVTSLQAAFAGAPGIAVGNVVGSNIANILLIMGTAAVITPVVVSQGTFRRDGAVLVGATLLGIGLALTGEFGRLSGVLFLAGLGGFLWLAFRQDAGETTTYEHEAEALPAPLGNIWLALGLFVGGLLVTILGARLLVDGAINIARDWGVSEAVIGLTIVAIGTSLPELVTSIVAARKGQADVALGNIIGSNIFNILGILGITALVKPIAVPSEIISLDIWVMGAATALLLWVCRSGWRITRTEGAVLLALYAAYLGAQAI